MIFLEWIFLSARIVTTRIVGVPKSSQFSKRNVAQTKCRSNEMSFKRNVVQTKHQLNRNFDSD